MKLKQVNADKLPWEKIGEWGYRIALAAAIAWLLLIALRGS